MKRGYARRHTTLRGKERAIRSGRPYLFEPCWTCASTLRLVFYLLLMMFDGVITRERANRGGPSLRPDLCKSLVVDKELARVPCSPSKQVTDIR
jgi:hypothetical protein